MTEENQLLEHTVQVLSILANPDGGSVVSPNPGSPMGFTIVEGTKAETDAMPVSKTTRNQAIKQALDIYAGLYDRHLEEDKAHFQVFKVIADSFTNPDDKCAIAEWILGVDPAPGLLPEDLPKRDEEEHERSAKEEFTGDYSYEFFVLSKNILLNDATSFSSGTSASALLAKLVFKVGKDGSILTPSIEDAEKLCDTLTGQWGECYERHGKPLAMVEAGLASYHKDYEADRVPHSTKGRSYIGGYRFQNGLEEKWKTHMDALEGEEKREALQRAVDLKLGLDREVMEELEKMDYLVKKTERTALMKQLLTNMGSPQSGEAPRAEEKLTNN